MTSKVRALAVATVVSAMAASISAFAPSASAATATATCAADSEEGFALAPGETFILTISGSCLWLGPGVGNIGSTTYGPSTGNENVLPANDWTPVTSGYLAIYTQPICSDSTSADALYTTTNAFSSSAPTGAYIFFSGENPCPKPLPVIQQFGNPSAGNCDAAAPTTLNLSGVASGGWSESWARWMNDGLGGAVCTRTLVYSTAQSKWVVG